MRDKQKTSKGPKPPVGRITMPDGSVRLAGVSAAARWLGCSQNSLSQVARGMPGRGQRLANRARAEFPALFANP